MPHLDPKGKLKKAKKKKHTQTGTGHEGILARVRGSQYTVLNASSNSRKKAAPYDSNDHDAIVRTTSSLNTTLEQKANKKQIIATRWEPLKEEHCRRQDGR